MIASCSGVAPSSRRQIRPMNGAVRPPNTVKSNQVEARSRQCVALSVDVADRGAVEAAVVRTLSALDRLDIVVNNAGVAERPTLETMTEATLQRELDVIVKGTIFVSQVAYPHLKTAGGAIVNVASVAGLVGGAMARAEDASAAARGRTGPAYAAAKGG